MNFTSRTVLGMFGAIPFRVVMADSGTEALILIGGERSRSPQRPSASES